MRLIVPVINLLLIIHFQNLIESKVIKQVKEADKSFKKQQPNLKLASISSSVQTYLTMVIKNNKNKIKTHNQDPNNSYKLAENKFIIYNQQQFAQTFLTLKVPDSLQNSTTLSIDTPSRLLLDINVDWKKLMKVTSVKYQGQCGSCYAFSSISAIESAYILQGRFINLSQQQLVDCSTNYGNNGCNGGWIGNAYQYIKDNSILSQSSYPYTDSFRNCSLPKNKSKYKISSFKTISNSCPQIISALLQQPVTIAVNANGWQYYSSGLFNDCQAGTVNHGVVLIGADSQSWKIKNSWGYAWGQLGYIRVALNATNQACQVCKYGSFPII